MKKCVLLFLVTLSGCHLVKKTDSAPKKEIEISLAPTSPLQWDNPTYAGCKDATHPDAHAHMKFVPSGLTLLDGNETVTTKFEGKDIHPISLGNKTATLDPNKKTVIFVLGYDGTGRSYDFFETKLWNKEFNTFIYRWHCESFTEDNIMGDVFESTDNAKVQFISDLDRLYKTLGKFYNKEIRFVSISMGGPLVLEALEKHNERDHMLNTSGKEDERFLRRADFLDPALLFYFGNRSKNAVQTVDRHVVPQERYQAIVRQISALKGKGYALSALTAAYAQILTGTLHEDMNVQRMDNDWLSEDFERLKNGESLGTMLQYDPERSQWNYQHIATVPAYFESLKENINPPATGRSVFRVGFTARTPTLQLRSNDKVFLRQTDGIGTLTMADDSFNAEVNHCPRANTTTVIGDRTRVDGLQATYYNIIRHCFN